MKLLNDMLNSIEATRQLGNTTALAEAAIKNNGILIVASHDQGELLKNKYPNIEICSISNLDSIRGLKKPLFFDNNAICYLTMKLSRVMDKFDQIKKLINE